MIKLSTKLYQYMHSIFIHSEIFITIFSFPTITFADKTMKCVALWKSKAYAPDTQCAGGVNIITPIYMGIIQCRRKNVYFTLNIKWNGNERDITEIWKTVRDNKVAEYRKWWKFLYFDWKSVKVCVK